MVKSAITSVVYYLIGSILLWGCSELQTPDPKPNILLINIDDLGWKDVGYMGSSYYETPNIDELAEDGMVFSRAYASAANCAPSRAALFTGQYAPRTGVYTVNSSTRGPSERRKLKPTPNTRHIDQQAVTVSEVLQKNGYRTAHIGKWHISENPEKHGFDVNVGGNSAGNPRANEMGGYFSPYNNPDLADGDAGEYLTDRLATETIKFIKSTEGEPFFVNFSPYTVHTPIQPKPELQKKYQKKEGSHGQENSGYAAMVETMDKNVGRIIEQLKAAGKYQNTFIVFTSDNGGVYRVTKQWPLRAGKGSYYEGGIRVPMVVVWPGVVSPSTTTDQMVSNIDFYPTFLEVAGINKAKNKVLDGTSLVPLLKENEELDRALFWHFPIYLQGGNKETADPYFRTRPGSVIQQGDWKLHEYFENDRIELYNIATDVEERKDLKELYPQKAAELKAKLKRWRQKTDAPVPDTQNPDFESSKN